MEIISRASLKPHNTFALEATARYLIKVSTLDDIKEALAFSINKNLPHIIIGEGSNIVFCGDINRVIILMQSKGIQSTITADNQVLVTAQAGERWHPFVQNCLQNNFYGIENLSLIPGTVGASPVQNIGAYGVELSDVLHKVEVIDVASGELLTLSNSDCQFAYRDSIFKSAGNDAFVITAVTLKLSLVPNLHTDYGDIHTELDQMFLSTITPQAIANAVCRIRERKLPNPKLLPNAGSFFKNPIADRQQFETIRDNFPELKAYPSGSDTYKLAAGWMIDQCKFKGYRRGDIGTHQHQALVLVNYGTATGHQIIELATKIQNAVQQSFGVMLEIEPRII